MLVRLSPSQHTAERSTYDRLKSFAGEHIARGFASGYGLLSGWYDLSQVQQAYERDHGVKGEALLVRLQPSFLEAGGAALTLAEHTERIAEVVLDRRPFERTQ